MTLYYLYTSVPRKHKPPSFQRFSIEHLPFPWDTINKDNVDGVEYEQPINPDQWRERISKLSGNKKADLKTVEKIKENL